MMAEQTSLKRIALRLAKVLPLVKSASKRLQLIEQALEEAHATGRRDQIFEDTQAEAADEILRDPEDSD